MTGQCDVMCDSVTLDVTHTKILAISLLHLVYFIYLFFGHQFIT